MLSAWAGQVSAHCLWWCSIGSSFMSCLARLLTCAIVLLGPIWHRFGCFGFIYCRTTVAQSWSSYGRSGAKGGLSPTASSVSPPELIRWSRAATPGPCGRRLWGSRGRVRVVYNTTRVLRIESNRSVGTCTQQYCYLLAAVQILQEHEKSFLASSVSMGGHSASSKISGRVFWFFENLNFEIWYPKFIQKMKIWHFGTQKFGFEFR